LTHAILTLTKMAIA